MTCVPQIHDGIATAPVVLGPRAAAAARRFEGGGGGLVLVGERSENTSARWTPAVATT